MEQMGASPASSPPRPVVVFVVANVLSSLQPA
jgi:hypothetical protein